MKLEINTPEAARDLAKTLRRLCEERAGSTLPVGHSLEVVAGLFGQPNWDTFSAMLKKAESVVADETVEAAVPACRVYFDVFSCGEWAESPNWAMVELTPTFVTRVRELQRLAHERVLSEVREWDEPDRWAESDVRLLEAELVVCPDGLFWYRAPVKHVDDACETRGIRLDQLLEMASKAVQGGKDYVVVEPREGYLATVLMDDGEIPDEYGNASQP